MAKSTENEGTASGKSKGADASSDIENMAQEVIKYIEEKAKDIDKATLAKYVAVAILVIWGLRKSNLLGSLAISLITGVVTKYMADMMENKSKGGASAN